MSRSLATQLRYARRDLRIACQLLDMAASDLSTCARAADDGRPLKASDLRQRSSDYARYAHQLLPKKQLAKAGAR